MKIIIEKKVIFSGRTGMQYIITNNDLMVQIVFVALSSDRTVITTNNKLKNINIACMLPHGIDGHKVVYISRSCTKGHKVYICYITHNKQQSSLPCVLFPRR